MQEGFDGALDVANRPPAPLAFSHTATLDQVVKNLSQKSKLKYFSRTESPGRDSARREAVRLEVNPAPTSRTEPVAILKKTRFHSEKNYNKSKSKNNRNEQTRDSCRSRC